MARGAGELNETAARRRPPKPSRNVRSARRTQLKLGDARRQVEAGLARYRQRLQRDRAIGAANQHVGFPAIVPLHGLVKRKAIFRNSALSTFVR